jgi:hypothetical protein
MMNYYATAGAPASYVYQPPAAPTMVPARETQSSALIPRTSTATQRGPKKSKIKLKPPQKIEKKKEETIELQLLIDDTNEMYKVYFNIELFPTMLEYFQYLSEQFNLPHPENFALRQEYPKGT